MQEILYKVHNNLYVNLTNKCPCACTFCLRQTMDRIGESSNLWLEHDPSAEEVIAEFSKWDMSQYNEVVFCGFGEPTEALDVLLEVAKYVKETYNKPVRINTNGMGNQVNGRDITPELDGLVDTVSISLNNPDPVKYQELVQCKYGEYSFDIMIDFAKRSTHHVPNVMMTTVDTTISKAEEERCAAICDEIGATYRIRPFEE